MWKIVVGKMTAFSKLSGDASVTPVLLRHIASLSSASVWCSFSNEAWEKLKCDHYFPKRGQADL